MAAGRAQRHRRAGAVGYAALITALSLAPAPVMEPLTPTIPHADKVAHAVAYGGYAWVLLWAARATRRTRAAVSAVAFCTLYGLAMESLQGALRPGDRTRSAADAAANAAGAAAGAAAWAVGAVARRRSAAAAADRETTA